MNDKLSWTEITGQRLLLLILKILAVYNANFSFKDSFYIYIYFSAIPPGSLKRTFSSRAKEMCIYSLPLKSLVPQYYYLIHKKQSLFIVQVPCFSHTDSNSTFLYLPLIFNPFSLCLVELLLVYLVICYFIVKSGVPHSWSLDIGSYICHHWIKVKETNHKTFPEWRSSTVTEIVSFKTFNIEFCHLYTCYEHATSTVSHSRWLE